MKEKIFKVAGTFAVAAFAFLAQSSAANAQIDCTFNRDLSVGDVGEDVRCLQRFLNSRGFVITDVGPGSPGQETITYLSMTKKAVMEWQKAAGISAPNGNFGPQSRAKYASQTASLSTTTVIPPSVSTSVVTPVSTPAATPAKAQFSSDSVKSAIKSLRTLMSDVENDIDDAEDDGDDIGGAKTFYDKAEKQLIQAIFEYMDGEYEEATYTAKKATEYAKDARDEIDGKSEEDEADADDAIKDAKKAIADAKSEINDADDDGDDVDEAEDLLDQAKAKYEDAKDAFDDDDFDEAMDLAKEAEDLADEAIDAL